VLNLLWLPILGDPVIQASFQGHTDILHDFQFSTQTPNAPTSGSSILYNMHCDSAEWYASPPFFSGDKIKAFLFAISQSHDPGHDSNIDAMAQSLDLHDV